VEDQLGSNTSEGKPRGLEHGNPTPPYPRTPPPPHTPGRPPARKVATINKILPYVRIN
jgi:hypothetical protein